MAGRAFAAGEQLTANLVNLYLATQYQYTVNNTAITSFTGAVSGAFFDFTGQCSVTINVNATGILLVRWGFEGNNPATATSTMRLGVALTGANTAPAPSTNISCTASTGTTGGLVSASRMHIFTGLNPGATGVKLQGYMSTVGAGTIDNQFLYVQNYL